MKRKNTSSNGNSSDVEISFFDCNCMVGKRADRRTGEPWTFEQLREDMKYYRISEALITHALSRDYDPDIGNKALTSLLAGSSHLFPVWCILPPSTGELSRHTTFVDSMLVGGAKAAISYARYHSYSLAPWSIGKLLSGLEHYRLPLILPFQQFDWNEVFTICHDYPELPVITTGINYRQLRFLLPLWEVCHNLYVDSSWLSIADLLPFLRDRNQLTKLLFGTNYPFYTPSAAVSMITYASTNKEEKQLVGGDSLRRLMANIKGN